MCTGLAHFAVTILEGVDLAIMSAQVVFSDLQAVLFCLPRQGGVAVRAQAALLLAPRHMVPQEAGALLVHAL